MNKLTYERHYRLSLYKLKESQTMNNLIELFAFVECEPQPVTYDFCEEKMNNIIKNYIYYPKKRFLEITR